jgi:hypothetical protein
LSKLKKYQKKYSSFLSFGRFDGDLKNPLCGGVIKNCQKIF